MIAILECTLVYGGWILLLVHIARTPYEEPWGWKELRRIGAEHLYRW